MDELKAAAYKSAAYKSASDAVGAPDSPFDDAHENAFHAALDALIALTLK